LKLKKETIMKKSLLIAIAAHSNNNIIGCDGHLPWHIPEDLKFFKQQTLHKPMIMGRKTRDSFGVKPLPNRPHIVISRDKNYHAEGSIVFDNFDSALFHAQALNAESEQHEIYVIGGGSLYFQVANMVDRFIISEIDITINGDTYFPNFDKTQFSQTILQKYPDLPIPFQIIQYDRLR
jgi:dihydrofolate reductase